MTRIVPLGDSAVLAYMPTEQEAIALAALARQQAPRWLRDAYAAYNTVAVFFDLLEADSKTVVDQLKAWQAKTGTSMLAASGRTHSIPCSYELQLDLDRIAEASGLTGAEAIRLHQSTEYCVYAIGFCPGFPYLGYLPDALANVPRLPSPRLRVEAGSIGLTGRQTGIYTEPRPGGWNLIGRTPLTLVDVADGYFPMQAGDRVRFVPIDADEFRRLKGERL